MTDVVVVETTVPSIEEAKKIGTSIIKEHLGACCQIVPNLHSIYIWKEKFEEASEVLLRIKTSRQKVPELISFLEKNHSYEVPELLLFSPECLSQSYYRFVATAVEQI